MTQSESDRRIGDPGSMGTPCGCSCGGGEGEPSGVSRRTVLRTATAAGALGLTAVLADVPWNRAESASAATDPASDVLVVLSLRGGFDGLSAIVPFGDVDYARARPNIAVPASTLLEKDSLFGLHPALAPLQPFWQAGTFGAVHAVGQRDASRSHFSAMAEMERAAPGTSLRTGWLDRMLGVTPTTSVFRATQVGGTGLLGSLTGPYPELVISSVDDFTINSAWNDAERARWTTALTALHRGARPSVAAPVSSAVSAMATTARVAKDTTVANGASYPDGDLGKALRDVARLIKANVGLRIAAVDYGNWDFHEGLGTVDSGRMLTELTELTGALAAFATDLGPEAMNGVTVVTLSEFGRRVAENGTGGVDHGLGNAVLLLGGGVVGGQVHGTWPGLGADQLSDGDLAGTTDYRAILAEILQKRCNVNAAGVNAVLPGFSGSPLGVVRQR